MSSSHTTTLDTIDCGERIGRRAWPLWNATATPSGGHQISDCHEVLIFFLSKNDIAKSATSFDNFDRTDHRRSVIEAAMHFYLRGFERARQEMNDKSATSFKHNTMPFSMFLETVVSHRNTDPDYVPDESNDHARAAKQAAVNQIVRDYGATRVNPENLMNGARSADGNAMFGSASTAAIKFMRDFDQDRDVIGYRIWLISREPNISIAAGMCMVLNEAIKFATENFGGGGSGGGPSKESAAQRKAQKTVNGAVAKIGNVVKDHECYRLLSSLEHYMEAVFIYSRNAHLNEPSIQAKCLSASVPIDHPDNMINPRRVFGAKAYFRDCANSKRIDPMQIDISNYFDERGSTWRFPYPNCVLVVPSVIWKVERFRRMYTPDHQKHMIEPRLDRNRGFADAPLPLSELQVTMAADGAVTSVQRMAVSRRADGPAISQADGAGDDNSLVSLDDAVNRIALDDDSIVLESDNNYVSDRARALQAANVVHQRRDESSDDNEDGSQALEVDGDDDDDDDDDGHGGRGKERAGDDSDADECDMPVDNDGVSKFDLPLPVDHNHLISDDFATADNSAQPAVAGDTVSLSQASNKTQLHTLRSMFYRAMMYNIDSITDIRRRAYEYTAMQIRSMDDYIAKCTQGCSNISAPGRAINTWMASVASRGELRFKVRRTAYVDRELSLFGTQMMQEIQGIDSQLALHTGHTELQLAFRAAMSAYHYSFNFLRPHLMMHGVAASSKSYPITVLTETLITGTVLSFTSQTTQADAHDDDDADLVVAYEEMPPNLIRKATGKGSDSGPIETLKDTMTRGTLTRKHLVVYDSGERKAHLSVSEKHVVYICASNMPRADFDDAMATRFIMRHHVQKKRDDQTIQQKSNQRTRNQRLPDLKESYERFVHNFRFGQAGHYHIEKLIMIGTLLEPTPTVFTTIFPIYCRHLKERHAISIDRRVGEQLMGVMRSMIINHAFYWLYHSPLSPYYRAKEFSMYQLLALNPMLKDTEEMAYYALDLFHESFINANHQAVIQCIRQAFMPQFCAINGHSSAIFSCDDGANGAAAAERDVQRYIAQQTGKPMPADTTVDVVDDDLEQPAGIAAAQQQQQKKSSGANSKKYDFNYVCIPLTLKKFATKLAAVMSKTDITRQLSIPDIEAALQYLSRSRVISHPYVWTRLQADAKVPLVSPNEFAGEMQYVTLRQVADAEMMFLHSSIAFDTGSDPHESAIRACMSTYTPTGKYISGLAVRDNRPHIMNVRHVGPTSMTPMVEPLPDMTARVGFHVSSARSASALPADNRDQQEVLEHDLSVFGAVGIDECYESPDEIAAQIAATDNQRQALMSSYDEYATVYRLLQIAMPVSSRTSSAYTQNTADAIARTLPGAMSREPIVYPDDVMTMSDRAREKLSSTEILLCDRGIAGIHELRKSDAKAAASFEMLDTKALLRDEEEDVENQQLTAIDHKLIAMRRRKRQNAEQAECNLPGAAEMRIAAKRHHAEMQMKMLMRRDEDGDVAAVAVAADPVIVSSAPLVEHVAIPADPNEQAENEASASACNTEAMLNDLRYTKTRSKTSPLLPKDFEHTQGPRYVMNDHDNASGDGSFGLGLETDEEDFSSLKPMQAMFADIRNDDSSAA